MPFAVELPSSHDDGLDLDRFGGSHRSGTLGIKEAFLEASKRVPDLVARESKPERFLVCEDGNAERAARRLTSYWKYRKELFGDRAFKPMLMTGTGALTDDDVETLTLGGAATLPSDLDGRPVFYLNRDRMNRDQMQQEMSRARCYFYLLNLGCMNDESQTKGIVVLSSVPNNRKVPISDSTFSKYGVAFGKIMPMKVACVHLLAVAGTYILRMLVNSLMAVALKMLGKYVGHSIEVQTDSTKEDVFARLRSHRIPKRCVPEEYGGSWTYKFKQWQHKQLKIEANDFMTEGEKLERKRKINVIHSRQKRFRRKVEQEVLDGRAAAIMLLNKDLMKKNAALESMLSAAKELVREHERMESSHAQAASRLVELRNWQQPRNLAQSSNSASSQPMPRIDSGTLASGLRPGLSQGRPAGLRPLTLQHGVHGIPQASLAGLTMQSNSFPASFALPNPMPTQGLGNALGGSSLAGVHPSQSALLQYNMLVNNHLALRNEQLLLSLMQNGQPPIGYPQGYPNHQQSQDDVRRRTMDRR